MGAMPRSFSLTGLIHQDRDGAEYFTRRDALLAALEEPGPGTLVHPTFGPVTVAAQPYSLSEEQGSLGVANFSMSFLRTDFIANPVAPERSATDVNRAADAVIAKAGAGLADGFSVAGGSAAVLQDAQALLTRIPDTMGAALGDIAVDAVGMASFTALAGNFQGNVGHYMGDPSALAGDMVGLADGFFASAATAPDGLRAASQMFNAVPTETYIATNTISGLMRQNNHDVVGSALQSAAYGLGVKSAVAMTYGNAEQLSPVTASLDGMYETLRSRPYV